MQLENELTQATRALVLEQLRAGATVTLTIARPSMMPTLALGDQVIVRYVPQNDLRVGDLVLVEWSAVWVAHRLIDRNGDQLITRGDAARSADLPNNAEQCVGVIIARRTRDGRVIDLQSPRARWFGKTIAQWARFGARRDRDIIARMMRVISRMGVKFFATFGVWMARG